MAKEKYRGLTSAITFVLILALFGSAICFVNADVVDNYFGILNGKIVNGDDTQTDSLYYRSAYGDGTFSNENLQLLVGDTYRQNIAEAAEGAVLLKNNGALPLQSDERKVDLFGKLIDKPINMGSGKYNVDLKAALKNESFAIDDGQSDIAIVMLSRSYGEGTDAKIDIGDGTNSLSLSAEEKEQLTEIRSSGKYRKIILLLNCTNPMELGWLDSEEYGVDAALWIGGPGLRGFDGIVSLLAGAETPSGRLTDTYAANAASAPACVNGGTNTPRWENMDYLKEHSNETASSIAFTNVQAENIYIGYKYYETRYEDAILNRFHADSSAGASFGNSTWNYADEVVFPFGYGLSYTTFRQTLDHVSDDGQTLTVSVTVTNTGAAAGKEVVQVYAQTPYGEYEMENLVEKASVNLVGFGKTALLQPGESETLTISVDKYLLASYDGRNAKGYLLSAGEYYLAIGMDAHDALNNILAAKGADGLYHADGTPASGNAENVFAWVQDAPDTESYRYSATGAEVTNRFDDCDINYWLPDSVIYLSRQDWEATYPKAQTVLAITDDMITVLNGETYQKPENPPSFSSFETGKDKGITAFDMMGVAYDDPKWEDFLSELSIDELCSLLSGAMNKAQINSIVLPSYLSGDGIVNLHARFSTNSEYSYDGECMRYCDQNVLASTWNPALYRSRGELMGEEMLFTGFFQLFGPGADLHRTAFGGRNYEYCSEDANLTYLSNIEIMLGLRSKGVSAQIKHLAGNDQEYNRQGLCTFFTEQAWREGSLRGFEGAFTKGDAASCMMGLNRIGLRWTNASKALCTNVLCEEWGFRGIIGTDGIGSKYQTHFTTTVDAGTDNFCLDSKESAARSMSEYLKASEDGAMLAAVRSAAKDNLYVLVNSPVMNGLTAESKIVTQFSWWKTVLICVAVVLLLLDAGVMTMWIKKAIFARKGR